MLPLGNLVRIGKLKAERPAIAELDKRILAEYSGETEVDEEPLAAPIRVTLELEQRVVAMKPLVR
jgi:hypothetical protein